MRILTLVRHAKSSWDYAELSDFERPLNERGRRDAPLMAQRSLRHGPTVDRLVSSPALRAITTARAFAEVLGMEFDELIVQPKIYEASAATLVQIVRALDDGDRHVMLFGHNPGFSQLALRYGKCPFNDMPTCAVARFEFDVSRWSDTGPERGTLVHYDIPKAA